MKLRNIFLGSTIVLLSLAFFALASVLYSVYAEEMRERARRHIEETHALLVEHVNARMGTITEGLETINHPLLNALRNLDRSRAGKAPDPLKALRTALPKLAPAMDEVRHLARKVGEEYVRIAIYDDKGILLLLYQSDNHQELTLSAYLPEVHADRLIVLRKERKIAWDTSTVTIFDERRIQGLKNADGLETLPPPPEIPVRISETYRGSAYRSFSILDRLPALRLRAPLSDAKTNLFFATINDHQAAPQLGRGAIDVTLQFSNEGIAKISSIMHTQINAFINERLTLGTLNTYDKISPGDQTALTLGETLSVPPVVHLQPKSIDGVNYYESRIALRGDFSESLILSVLEPRTTEEKSIAAFLYRLALIALLFGAVFFLIIFLLNKQLVLPIVRMQETIKALTRGAFQSTHEIRNVFWINEIRTIQNALAELATVNQKIAKLANRVADGNFGDTIEPRSENDVLIQALNRMEVRLVEQREQISQQNMELRTLANTDGLTGIFNRRYFDHLFEYNYNIAKRNNIPITVMMIDIDYFKKFNDHFGHQSGDDCLIAVAKALSRCAMRQDDIVARYGGEEFVIVSLGNDPEHSQRMAKTLCHEVGLLKIDHPLSEHSIVTISVGWCSAIPRDPLSTKELLKRADEALYQAKIRGRNRAEMFQRNQGDQPA